MSDQSNTHHEQAKEIAALKERIRELEAIEAECKQMEAALKENKDKYRLLADHDSLTGLPNRKLFSDRVGIALAQAGRNQNNVAVIMLDLDNFKDKNDTLGHDTGDLLLKAVTERLNAAMRKSDTVARFGGDA